jgi:hypothetical protein
MQENRHSELPECASEYIELVISRMRCSSKTRREVRRELTAHFADATGTCSEGDESVEELIRGFGDAEMLAKLIKRGKKRCRPLWLRSLIVFGQVFGVLLLVTIGRVVYLAVGTCTPAVDYVKWMNDAVREGRSEDLNALPYYSEAVRLGKPIPETLNQVCGGGVKDKQITAEQWDEIKGFLAADTAALDALRHGAEKPSYWNVYQGREVKTGYDLASQVVMGIEPDLQGYKRLAREIANLEIPWLLHNNRPEDALDESIVLHRFACHLGDNGMMIEQLVGIAIEAMAYETTLSIIADSDISYEKLTGIQAQLEQIHQGSAGIDLRTETAFWYDAIQRTFTDDGKDSGRPTIKALPLAVNDVKGALRGFVAGYPDRKEITKGIEKVFDKLAALNNQTPWQLKKTGFDDSQLEKIADGQFLLKVSVPAMFRSMEIAWRARLSQRALTAVIAILRYEKQRGEYPEKLEDVVTAGYLKELPQDPYSDKPLEYKHDGESFTLYSFGPDMDDDQGRMGLKNDKPFKWADDGDAVFWPHVKQ